MAKVEPCIICAASVEDPQVLASRNSRVPTGWRRCAIHIEGRAFSYGFVCPACVEALSTRGWPAGDTRPCQYVIGATRCGYPEMTNCHDGHPGPEPPNGRHQYLPPIPQDMPIVKD